LRIFHLFPKKKLQCERSTPQALLGICITGMNSPYARRVEYEAVKLEKQGQTTACWLPARGGHHSWG